MIPRGQRDVRVGELVRRGREGPQGLVLRICDDSGNHPLFADVLVRGAVVTWYIDDIAISPREIEAFHQRSLRLIAQSR